MKVHIENQDGTSNERYAFDLRDAFQLLSTLYLIDKFEEAIITDQNGQILGAFHHLGIGSYTVGHTQPKASDR